MGEGSPIGTVAEGSGAATAVTRAELVAFQGKIEERLAELLSLARTQPGDGDATTPPAQRTAAPATAQAPRRELPGNGGSREDPEDSHSANGGANGGDGCARGGRGGRTDRRGTGRGEEDVATPNQSDDERGGSGSSSNGTLPGWGGGGGADAFAEKRHAQRGAIVYHPDGFDDSNLPAADDIIQA